MILEQEKHGFELGDMLCPTGDCSSKEAWPCGITQGSTKTYISLKWKTCEQEWNEAGNVSKRQYMLNLHWPKSLELFKGFCMVCEEQWLDLYQRPFTLKATTISTAPRRL